MIFLLLLLSSFIYFFLFGLGLQMPCRGYAVSYRPLTPEVRVRPQTRVCEIYEVQIGTWTGFSTRRGFSPAHTRLHLLVVHAGRTKCMNERAAHKSNFCRSARDAAVPLLAFCSTGRTNGRNQGTVPKEVLCRKMGSSR
jgi:hypothetical protein